MTTNANAEQTITSRLTEQADAIGQLAKDTGGFAAVAAAFESSDPNAFRWVLDRLELLPRCELICEWVQTKMCALRCVEVCGPVWEGEGVPSLQEFARALVQLGENEKLLRRVVDAVTCGDAEAYQASISELKLGRFCHLICRWVCSSVYHRVCEIVCVPGRVYLPDAVSEIRASAKEIASLLANEKAIASIGKVAEEFNCKELQTTISATGAVSSCEIICRLVCSLHCYKVCRELCVRPVPILTGAAAIAEAREFALASLQLASQQRLLSDLVSAVQNVDAQSYSEIIGRLKLEPYCHQVCSWVCSELCHEFCECVCPNQAFDPLFTTVGAFNIYSDIGSSGKTNKSLPVATLDYGGGPNFAFYGLLQLGGYCPATSPTFGTPMMYRFQFASAATTLAGAITAGQTSVTVASSAGVPATPFDVSLCIAGATGETMTVTAVAGTTWTVARGQKGTTAMAAAAGTTLWLNLTPIAGGFVGSVEAGSRLVSWPENVAGIAGSTPVWTSQSVYVQDAPTPPDIAPPLTGAAWFGPGNHYINPDPVTGWVEVDPNAVGGGFSTLLGFDTNVAGAALGGDPLPISVGCPGSAPAGSAVAPAAQGVGTNLTIIFEATRVGVATIDYSNSLCNINVNNWSEVNNLWFAEFGSGSSTDCCTPIVDKLSVQFTVDHEDIAAWSLGITSCSASAPGDITPTASGPTVTLESRGGYGTVYEDTSMWTDCSYAVTLTTRPGLTTGLRDRDAIPNQLTFCICGGPGTPVTPSAKKR